jgi:hypothetical protein
MAPSLQQEELNNRYIWNPPRNVRLDDLISAAKDGLYVKDQPSDYIVGMLLVAEKLGFIENEDGGLFQVPFYERNGNCMNLRVIYRNCHYGHAFLGPDGKVLSIGERLLCGDEDHDNSDLTIDTIDQHPNYNEWLCTTFFPKRTRGDSYHRITTNDSKKDCDDYVNSFPYTPGPNHTFPGPNANRMLRNMMGGGAIENQQAALDNQAVAQKKARILAAFTQLLDAIMD